MNVAIVKYNAGNATSVCIALQRLGVEPMISDDRSVLASADKVIFPGVGEASAAMRYLREHGLDESIRSVRRPFLGICLGMQLLCESSEESATECLGVIPNRVLKFPSNGLKVPQIGWNTVSGLRSALFDGIDEGTYFYFVHGYYVEPGIDTIANAEYGVAFSAAINRANFYGVQFHPERSGQAGRRVLENFLKL